MKLKVKRIFRGETYTIGKLYVNDKYFCDTLEDKCRIVNGNCADKIFAETAIPEGTYEVEVIWWDRHKNYYPHIKDVPCFTGIMIHGGVDEADTQGCILLGENKVKGHLQNCLTYVRQLTILLQGQQATIEII